MYAAPGFPQLCTSKLELSFVLNIYQSLALQGAKNVRGGNAKQMTIKINKKLS
jgi:hypothetical protein